MLFTHNPGDFRKLHAIWQAQGRTHSGILLIYQDNIRGKDMEPADVPAVIGNLLASGIPVSGETHILNQWR